MVMSSYNVVFGRKMKNKRNATIARAVRAFTDVRACAPLIGWGPAIRDRLLKRAGVKELKLKVDGLPNRVCCRVATSDIFEFAHLLGRASKPLELPFVPRIIVDAGANVGYSSLKFQKEFPVGHNHRDRT